MKQEIKKQMAKDSRIQARCIKPTRQLEKGIIRKYQREMSEKRKEKLSLYNFATLTALSGQEDEAAEDAVRFSHLAAVSSFSPGIRGAGGQARGPAGRGEWRNGCRQDPKQKTCLFGIDKANVCANITALSSIRAVGQSVCNVPDNLAEAGRARHASVGGNVSRSQAGAREYRVG